MPSNPNAALPDKVAANIADSDTVVSEDYAVSDNGELKDIETGKTVTDPKLVGTKDKQPDPLAKTDGESFIPVEASEVKQKVAEVKGDAAVEGDSATSDSADSAGNAAGTDQSNGTDAGQSGTEGSSAAGTAGAVSDKSAKSSKSTKSNVKLASLQNNGYGAHWGTYNGTAAFYDANNNLFVQQAKGVVDVSVFQGDIDWQAAKNAGVEGAIIRISFGAGNGFDAKALRNISECKRLGIPFGVYTYSYAENSSVAAEEGNDIVNLLRQAGVSPGDLSYPVYYDLERWTWAGHAPPTDPNVYEGIVNTWYSKLQAAGYNNLSVYSYTSYLNSALNKASIHAKTRWVAQYGSTMGFTNWSTNDRGWQYTSGGSVAGISGRVDLNAFGYKEYHANYDVRGLEKLFVPKGTYYIDSVKKLDSSVSIDGKSSDSGAVTDLQSGDSSSAHFQLIPQDDGSYEIVNEKSGLALDVSGGNAFNRAVVHQWERNNTTAQRWWLRSATSGGVFIQSALGNWVLDLTSGNTTDGTVVQLYEPNDSEAQHFVVTSATAKVPSNPVRLTSGGEENRTLGIANDSYDDGAKVQLQDWTGSDSQLFKFSRVGKGLYEIRNLNSAKAIEAASGGTAKGTAVRQWTANNTIAQRWAIYDSSAGGVVLVSAKSGRVVDVPSGNLSAGTIVQLWNANGTVAQMWKTSTSQSTHGGLVRLSGIGRYETANAVVAAGFEKSDWVVIASGETYPDALSASALAGALDAPVLLSQPDALRDDLADRIRSLGASKAVLIGGEGALSSTLESQVRNLVSSHSVYRFGGETRYDTSLSILRDAPAKLGISWSKDKTAIIVSGESPYDALSISSLAWKKKQPIVLTGLDGLETRTLNVLHKEGFKSALLIGGKGVVPITVEQQLYSMNPVRLGGQTRYETSLEVVKYAQENVFLRTNGAVFASGENYPDALVGGALAGKTGNVLALVSDGDMSSATIDFIADKQNAGSTDTAYVLGGAGVLSASTEISIAAKLNKHIQ
ncbi:cell wall-binding repeat-containing protein [Bifidobacterium colobi]